VKERRRQTKAYAKHNERHPWSQVEEAVRGRQEKEARAVCMCGSVPRQCREKMVQVVCGGREARAGE